MGRKVDAVTLVVTTALGREQNWVYIAALGRCNMIYSMIE